MSLEPGIMHKCPPTRGPHNHICDHPLSAISALGFRANIVKNPLSQCWKDVLQPFMGPFGKHDMLDTEGKLGAQPCLCHLPALI